MWRLNGGIYWNFSRLRFSDNFKTTNPTVIWGEGEGEVGSGGVKLSVLTKNATNTRDDSQRRHLYQVNCTFLLVVY